jgi:hypothetical protein
VRQEKDLSELISVTAAITGLRGVILGCMARKGVVDEEAEGC